MRQTNQATGDLTGQSCQILLKSPALHVAQPIKRRTQSALAYVGHNAKALAWSPDSQLIASEFVSVEVC